MRIERTHSRFENQCCIEEGIKKQETRCDLFSFCEDYAAHSRFANHVRKRFSF